MIEPVMYLAIGFLVSMLFGLMVLPLVHNRAVRLTTRRLEAATPISMAEIQADKDQLRAEFAMSARRLEMSVEQLKNKTTSQLAEIGKKADAINRMKIELGEKNAAIFVLESREKVVREQLRSTEVEFAAKTEALRTAEAAFNEKQAELAKLSRELQQRSNIADDRDAEMAVLRAEIETLRSRVSQAEHDYAATQTRLASDRTESATASRDLAEARERMDGLGARVGELDHALATQKAASEVLHKRIGELESSLAEQTKLLEASDAEVARLRTLNADIAGGGLMGALTQESPALDKLRADNARLEDRVRAAEDERSRVQRELASVQAQAESAWASERVENALLRERINDIAAEVARLAMTLEGPHSTIDAILASAPLVPAPPHDEPAPAAASVNGTLADRIRALQVHASRARASDAPNAPA